MKVSTMCPVKHIKAKCAQRPNLGVGLCPICGCDKDRPGYSYCRLCWNAYQRAKRPKYKNLSLLERRRNIIRSYHNVYRRRGKILADLCFTCGSRDRIELHHPDIDKSPGVIVPLCHKCHRFLHIGSKPAKVTDFS